MPDIDVDFTKYQVIAVIDEVRNYGGYSIDITKITKTNNSIFVTIKTIKTRWFLCCHNSTLSYCQNTKDGQKNSLQIKLIGTKWKS